MGQATSKGTEAKSKMKHPRFEHGGCDLWSNTLLLDHRGALRDILKNKVADRHPGSTKDLEEAIKSQFTQTITWLLLQSGWMYAKTFGDGV